MPFLLIYTKTCENSIIYIFEYKFRQKNINADDIIKYHKSKKYKLTKHIVNIYKLKFWQK